MMMSEPFSTKDLYFEGALPGQLLAKEVTDEYGDITEDRWSSTTDRHSQAS